MIATDIEAEEERVTAALHPTPGFRRWQFVRALACVLAVPAAVYLLVFAAALGPGSALRSLGLSKFGPVLDYGYEARHVDADVLIYGDSSAFLGVDPRVVQSTLHLRTAVLPNTIGSLPVTGELVLRRYFEHNRRPRTLVLYFSPWNLDYAGRQNREFLLEGEEEVLRYGSWTDIAHAFARYPASFVVFPFQVLEPLGIRHLHNALHHADAGRGLQTAAALGHWDYTLPYPALQNDCQLRQEYTRSLPHETVHLLQERYKALGMRVVVYLAPIPDCRNAGAVRQHTYADVAAAPPALLPPGWFADDSFTAHVRPEHVEQTSRLFAERLRQVLVLPTDRR